MRVRPSGLPAIGALLALGHVGCGGCGKSSAALASDASAAPVPSSSAVVLGAAKPGMAWIPAGVLHAGTPVDRVPRVPDEEPPGTEMTLGGFYIDLYPYPNEAGAIPTSNVSREDAAHLCETKGKRLCTELEWERSCKGPDNFTYEYGDAYRASSCITGVAIEESARRPSGERLACKSPFGVMDLHGGVWEWTDSAWKRGAKGDLGVLRGGNSIAGEIVGRCANGIGRNVTSKGATMGFRCCMGPRNPAEVSIEIKPTVPIERSMKPSELAAPLLAFATTKWGSENEPFTASQAWTWHPASNEELVIASGCAKGPDKTKKPLKCGIVVGRASPAAAPLLAIDAGRSVGEVVLFGDARHLRMLSVDARSAFVRTITYAYGRIELGEIKR